MGFSLFFWRKKPKTQADMREPSQPAAAPEAQASPSTQAHQAQAAQSAPQQPSPSMPFVRDETKATHPRLQRMAELLQTLPQPPNSHAPQSASIPAAPHYPTPERPSEQAPAEHTSSDTPQRELPAASRETQPSTSAVDASELFKASTSIDEQVRSIRSSDAPVAEHASPHAHVDVREQPPTPHPAAPPRFTQENEERSETTATAAPPLHVSLSRLMRAPTHKPTQHEVSPAVHHHEQPLFTATPPTSAPPAKPALQPNFSLRANNAFYAHDGRVLWTLEELADALEHMSDESFSHHVREGHNDFANWIEGCFHGDEQVFGSMIHGLDRHAMKHLFTRYQRMQSEQKPTDVPHSTQHHPTPPPTPPKHVLLDEPAFTSAPFHAAPPQPVMAASTQEAPHFDDKGPALIDIQPVNHHESGAAQAVLDALNAAELLASHDIGSAREAFIAVRTRVWQELGDAEREKVLPRMRDVYEKLRSRS